MAIFEVVRPVAKSSGISTISVNSNNLEVLDSKGESLARIVTSHIGKKGSLKLTGADGHVSNVSFTVASDASKTITVTGTYNDDPFHQSIASNGTISNVLRPQNLNPADADVARAVLHMKFPEPTISEEKATEKGGGHTPKPMTDSVGCGLAVLGAVAAGWELGPLSGSIAIHAIVWECFIV